MRRAIPFLLAFGSGLTAACGEDQGAGAVLEVYGDLGGAIHFELAANIPYARVSINGSEPKNFILDTGAQLVLVDTAFGKEIGYETTIFPKPLDSLTIGDLEFTHVPAVAYDLSALTGELGVQIDGFVGASLFEHFTMAFDYKERNVYFLDGDESALALDARSDIEHEPKEIAGRTSYGFFRVDAAFEPDGEPIEVLLDTGASATVLTETAFDTLGIPDDRARIPGLAGNGQVGSFMLDLVRTCKVAAGEAELEDMVLAIAPDEVLSQAKLLFPKLSGVLGYTFLREFLVVIDYDDDRARLYPFTETPHIHENELISVGLIAARDGERVVVAAVVPGSDAEEKGVMKDDVLLSIDGKSVAAMSDGELGDALSGDVGVERALVLERDGADLSISVSVEDLLPRC